MVAEQLPAEHPVKQRAMSFIDAYERKFGKGSMNIFASNAWDAWLLLEHAIPKALERARPGTPEFRRALRDAIEGTKNLVSTQGVFNMTPTDHVGYDRRAAVMVQVKNGTWKLVQ
jgi:branched-chain amino acid transport system substrate-binding protein